MENMEIWDKVKRPPAEALKTIRAGRLKGMSDISPQWRYQIMTEVFGACGTGWWFTVQKLWSEDGADGVKFAFAHVNLFYMLDSKGPDGEYCASEPIPGIGGSTIVAKESAGLHSSDEGYKMAITDALSTTMKMLGVAADIYAGKWDGSKYKDDKPNPQPPPGFVPPTDDQKTQFAEMLADAGLKPAGGKNLTMADAKKYGLADKSSEEFDVIYKELNRKIAAGENL